MTVTDQQSTPIPEFPPGPADWALFLDMDGTLLEITPTPDRIRVPGILPLLLRWLDTLARHLQSMH
jgi:trehalose-6-phosphatase